EQRPHDHGLQPVRGQDLRLGEPRGGDRAGGPARAAGGRRHAPRHAAPGAEHQAEARPVGSSRRRRRAVRRGAAGSPAPRFVPLPNVSFVSRGRVPPNPSELLMHENFTRFIASVVPSYDLIIIDTPPILAVTDAAVIGHHAGTSLLVARFGLNKARELALAKQ